MAAAARGVSGAAPGAGAANTDGVSGAGAGNTGGAPAERELLARLCAALGAESPSALRTVEMLQTRAAAAPHLERFVHSVLCILEDTADGAATSSPALALAELSRWASERPELARLQAYVSAALRDAVSTDRRSLDTEVCSRREWVSQGSPPARATAPGHTDYTRELAWGAVGAVEGEAFAGSRGISSGARQPVAAYQQGERLVSSGAWHPSAARKQDAVEDARRAWHPIPARQQDAVGGGLRLRAKTPNLEAKAARVQASLVEWLTADL